MTLRYLLDTNVVSEPLRPHPDPGVMEKLRELRGSLAIAAVVWHELVYGACRLPPSSKRTAIEEYLETVVAAELPVLPYDEAAADWHGRERSRLETIGRTPSVSDAQIAATAHAHGLIVVTGNTRQFEPFRDLRVEDWRTREPEA